MEFMKSFKIKLDSKLIAFFLLLSAFTFTICLIIGLFTNELFGYIAFGLFISCIFITLSTVFSLRASELDFQFVRYIWLLTTSLILFFIPFLKGSSGNIIVSYSMMILSFPSGLVLSPLLFSLTEIIKAYIESSIILWLAFLSIGYIQWFVIFKTLFRKSS